MKITERDSKLITDVSLSQIVSRDQLLELGYYNTVTRLNSRLREHCSHGFLEVLTTPFFHQHLYGPGRNAMAVVGPKTAKLIDARSKSPRWVQHSLSITNVRIALRTRGILNWIHEAMLWRKFERNGKVEIRPDGLAISQTLPIFIEVDLGHVSQSKFSDKLQSYKWLAASSSCERLYGFRQFRLLVVTTTISRARNLRQLVTPDLGFECIVETFEQLGAKRIEGWS